MFKESQLDAKRKILLSWGTWSRCTQEAGMSRCFSSSVCSLASSSMSRATSCHSQGSPASRCSQHVVSRKSNCTSFANITLSVSFCSLIFSLYTLLLIILYIFEGESWILKWPIFWTPSLPIIIPTRPTTGVMESFELIRTLWHDLVLN